MAPTGSGSGMPASWTKIASAAGRSAPPVDPAIARASASGSIGGRVSALHGAGGEARDEVVDEERVEDRDRHRSQQRSGHQLSPEEVVAVDELLGHADRDGLDQAVVHEYQRVQEL